MALSRKGYSESLADYRLWRRLEDELIKEFLSQHSHDGKIDKRKGFRRPNLDHNSEKRTRVNYYETIWWKMLQQDREALKISTSRQSQLFRLRFRLPLSNI